MEAKSELTWIEEGQTSVTDLEIDFYQVKSESEDRAKSSSWEASKIIACNENTLNPKCFTLEFCSNVTPFFEPLAQGVLRLRLLGAEGIVR